MLRMLRVIHFVIAFSFISETLAGNCYKLIVYILLGVLFHISVVGGSAILTIKYDWHSMCGAFQHKNSLCVVLPYSVAISTHIKKFCRIFQHNYRLIAAIIELETQILFRVTADVTKHVSSVVS